MRVWRHTDLRGVGQGGAHRLALRGARVQDMPPQELDARATRTGAPSTSAFHEIAHSQHWLSKKSTPWQARYSTMPDGAHAPYSRVHGRIAARGFIPAETLVQNDTAGDNGTAGGTLNQSVIGFLVG